MEFRLTRKTSFMDGSDHIKAAAIEPGKRVTVEAKKAPDNSLDAIYIRIEHPKN